MPPLVGGNHLGDQFVKFFPRIPAPTRHDATACARGTNVLQGIGLQEDQISALAHDDLAKDVAHAHPLDAETRVRCAGGQCLKGRESCYNQQLQVAMNMPRHPSLHAGVGANQDRHACAPAAPQHLLSC